jgi:hypothetical protein
MDDMKENPQGFPPSLSGADDATERDNNPTSPMGMDGKPANSEVAEGFMESGAVLDEEIAKLFYEHEGHNPPEGAPPPMVSGDSTNPPTLQTASSASACAVPTRPPKIIQDWQVVLGDKQAGSRSTPARKILVRAKQWYKSMRKEYVDDVGTNQIQGLHEKVPR